jgi:membrane-bound metal-dependent hydrolase YbcI (DUF457 family)
MHGTPHLLIGAGCGLALTGGDLEHHWPLVPACAVAALLPDLDHAHSTGSRWWRLGLGLIGLWAGAAAVVGVLTYVPAGQYTPWLAGGLGVLELYAWWHVAPYLQPARYFEHRGLFHSLLAADIAATLALLLVRDGDVALAVLVGWLSHLAADALSPWGEPLLWPLGRELIHVVPARYAIRSGSWWAEYPLAFVVLLAGARVVLG